MLFLHSLLIPILSNVLHIISNDWIEVFKVWGLVLNYQCLKSVFGVVFYFLEFSSVKCSIIITAHRIQREANFKHEIGMGFKGSFFGLCYLPLRKNGLIDFLEKTSSDQRKIFATSLTNFTEFHRRKRENIHCQFLLFVLILTSWNIKKHWRFRSSARR